MISLTQEPGSLNLTYAISFLPLARSSAMLEYYNNIDQEKLCDSRTEIVAMDFGECDKNLSIPYTWRNRNCKTFFGQNFCTGNIGFNMLLETIEKPESEFPNKSQPES